MAHDGKESHLSGALSCTDILIVLFNGFLNIPSDNQCVPERDRFVFSKGHACSAMYAVLTDKGCIPTAYLDSYALNDSPLPNHPCKLSLPLLEMSSGSLGQGLGFLSGMLYGMRLKENNARGVVLMSDGECNEGSVWEAAMFAGAQRLDRLLAIVDNNGRQAVGKHADITGFTELKEKFISFGWHAECVDGHNLQALYEVLNRFPFSPGKPSVIIAKTVPGAGVSFMEDDQVWFYRRPSKDDVEAALRELDVVPLHKG